MSGRQTARTIPLATFLQQAWFVQTYVHFAIEVHMFMALRCHTSLMLAMCKDHKGLLGSLSRGSRQALAA